MTLHGLGLCPEGGHGQSQTLVHPNHAYWPGRIAGNASIGEKKKPCVDRRKSVILYQGSSRLPWQVNEALFRWNTYGLCFAWVWEKSLGCLPVVLLGGGVNFSAFLCQVVSTYS